MQRRLDIAPAPSSAPAPTAAGSVPTRPPPPGPLLLSVTNDANTLSIALLQQELFLLRNLLGLSIPYLTGWQYQLLPTSFDPSVNLASARASQGEDDGADFAGEEIVAMPEQQQQQQFQQQQQPKFQQQQQQQQQPQHSDAPSYPQRGGYRR